MKKNIKNEKGENPKIEYLKNKFSNELKLYPELYKNFHINRFFTVRGGNVDKSNEMLKKLFKFRQEKN